MIKKLLIITLTTIAIINTSNSDQLFFYFENDVLFKDDFDYTNGIELKYMRNKPISIFGLDFDDYGMGVLQLMFTPTTLKIPHIIYNDRPYVGLLASNFILQKQYKHHYDNYEILLGVIGEWSYADKTQKYIHKKIDAANPVGWHNQLPNEVVANFMFTRAYQFDNKLYKSIFMTYEPKAKIQFGTWQNDLEGMLDLKLGSKQYKPTDHGIQQRHLQSKSNYNFYLLCGCSIKYVLYSTQLDGNVFGTPEHWVDSEDFVYEYRYGIGVGYKKFELNFLSIIRSKEYTTQYKKAKFNSINASIAF